MHTSHNTDMKRGCKLLVALYVIALFFFAGHNILSADYHPETAQAEETHTLSFSQADLVGMLQFSIDNGLYIDEIDFTSDPHAFGTGPDGSPVIDETRAQWLREQLGGAVLLNVYTEADGCSAFVAFHTGERKLMAATINHTSEAHAFSLQAELTGYGMAGHVDYYTETQDPSLPSGDEDPVDDGSPEPVPDSPEEPSPDPDNVSDDAPGQGDGDPDDAPDIDEPAPDDETDEPESSPSGESADDLLTADFGQILRTPETVDPSADGELPEEAVPALPEDAAASEPEDVQTEAAEPEDDPVLELQGSATYKTTSGQLAALIPAGGTGVMTLETGMLYGGALSSGSATQSGIAARGNIVEAGQLQGGPKNPVDGQNGLLRLYSRGDKDANGNIPVTEGNYATYSKDSHAVYYDVTNDALLYLTLTPAQPHFTLELRNSKSITARTYDANMLSVAGVPSGGYSQTIRAIADNATLVLTNAFGPGIDYSGTLYLEGNGTVIANGINYGVTTSHETKNATGISMSGGFSLIASSGDAVGLNCPTDLSATSGETLHVVGEMRTRNLVMDRGILQVSGDVYATSIQAANLDYLYINGSATVTGALTASGKAGGDPYLEIWNSLSAASANISRFYTATFKSDVQLTGKFEATGNGTVSIGGALTLPVSSAGIFSMDGGMLSVTGNAQAYDYSLTGMTSAEFGGDLRAARYLTSTGGFVSVGGNLTVATRLSMTGTTSSDRLYVEGVATGILYQFTGAIADFNGGIQLTGAFSMSNGALTVSGTAQSTDFTLSGATAALNGPARVRNYNATDSYATMRNGFECYDLILVRSTSTFSGGAVRVNGLASVTDRSKLNLLEIDSGDVSALHIVGTMTFDDSAAEIRNITGGLHGVYVGGTSDIKNGSELLFQDMSCNGNAYYAYRTLTVNSSSLELNTISGQYGLNAHAAVTLTGGRLLLKGEMGTSSAAAYVEGLFTAQASSKVEIDISGSTTHGLYTVGGYSLQNSEFAARGEGVQGYLMAFGYPQTSLACMVSNCVIGANSVDSPGTALMFGGEPTFTSSAVTAEGQGSLVSVMEHNGDEFILNASQLTVSSGSSPGRALYLSRNEVLMKVNANATVQINADNSTIAAMQIAGFLNITGGAAGTAQVTVDAGNSPGKSVFLSYGTASVLTMSGYTAAGNNPALLTITRDSSQDDALYITCNLLMSNGSRLDVRSESEDGRSIYVRNRTDVFTGSHIYAKSNTIIADGGESPDPDGTAPEPGETPEEPVEEEDEDPVPSGDDASIFEGDDAAVIYFGARTRVRNASSIVAEGNGATPYAIIVKTAYLHVESCSLVKGSNAKSGIRAYDVQLLDGSSGYGTKASMEDTAKSRLVGIGTQGYGIIVVHYLDPRAGTFVYGEGLAAGIRVYNVVNSSSRTLRTDATVIGYGSGNNSSGLLTTANLTISSGLRLIAEGGVTGIQMDSGRGNFINAQYYGEIIAIGRARDGSGILRDESNSARGRIRSRTGGKMYARGDKYGIYGYRCRIESHAGSESAYYYGTLMIGIGGVDDSAMTASLDVINTPFAFGELPSPMLSEGNNGSKVWNESDIEVPGLVPFKAGSAGIVTGARDDVYIRSWYRGELFGYGGEYGIISSGIALENDELGTSGSYVEARRGGYIEGHGGRVGIEATTLIRSHGGNYFTADRSKATSIIKGYGSDYGISSGTNLYTESSSHTVGKGYIYGIGKINGIRIGGYYRTNEGGIVVGETWIDPEAKALDEHGVETGDPMAQPAVVATKRRTSRTAYIAVATHGLVHEIYNPINMVFKSPPAYQFNTEFDALGQNMGEDARRLLDFTWTTPSSHPNINTDPGSLGQDWIDYDASDDRKLVKSVMGRELDGSTPRPGLMTYGYADDVTIVANIANANSGSYASYAGCVQGTGGYRVTFRHVKIRDSRTLQLEIDLREQLLGSNLDLSSLSPELAYELEFRPEDPEGLEAMEDPMQKIDITSSDMLDASTGKITLHKLRQGSYILRVKQDVGWPYTALPEIHFRVAVDTSPADPANWHESVFIDTGQDQTPAGRASAAIPSEALSTPDAASEPSIPAPPGGPDGGSGASFAEIFNVTSYYRGKVEVYYEREQYGLELRLADMETLNSLNGRIKVKWTLDNAAVGSGSNEKTVTVSNTQWPLHTVYAGLEYEFSQESGASGYDLSSGSVRLRVMYDPDREAPQTKHYFRLISDTNGSAIYAGSDGESPNYHVLLRSETRLKAYYELHVKERGTSDVFLESAAFRLEVQVGDDIWRDISATNLTSLGDGKFTLKASSGDRLYRLTQTGSNGGYSIREGSYVYKVGSVTSSSYRITKDGAKSTVPLDDTGSDGWVSPLGTSVGPIVISNILSVGDLEVIVTATGLWYGHDDAVFLVELQGASPGNAGKVYYDYVRLRGSANLITYKTDQVSGSVMFEDIAGGNYTVKVYGALRTDRQNTQTACAKSVPESVTFSFASLEDAYLTGADAAGEDFTIGFP